jgi:hypothetical protein
MWTRDNWSRCYRLGENVVKEIAALFIHSFLLLLQKLRMRSLSFPMMIGIWLLIHSYVLVYVFLFFAAVSEVSIINAVFMLFFFVLLFLKRIALFLWVALVAFTQLVIVALFFWQFPFTESLRSDTTKLVGLIVFDNVWTGLVWQFLTLAAALMQLYISRYRDETNVDLRLDMADIGPSLKFIIYCCEWALYNSVILLVYLALLLVGLLSTVSLLSLASLVFLGLLLLVDFVIATPTRRLRALRFVWPVLILWASSVLALCYIVQLPIVFDALQTAFAANDYSLTLSDLGIRLEANVWTRSYYLFGPAAILLVSILQSSLFGSPISIDTTRRFQRNATTMSLRQWCVHHAHWLHAIILFCGRLLALHSSKVTVLVVFGAIAISRITLIGAIYAALAIASLVLDRGLAGPILGLVLLFFTLSCVVGQLLFQLSFLEGVSGPIYTWVGLGYADAGVVTPSVVALLLVLFQKWSTELALPDARVLGTTYRNSALASQLLLFDTDPQLVKHDKISLFPLLHKLGHILSLAYSKFGFEIVLVMSVLDCFIRSTVLSMVILLFLAISSFVSRRSALSSFPFMYCLWSMCLLAQYFFSLGLPTSSEILFPWRVGLSESVQTWLCLLLPHPSYLVADFMVVFLLSLSMKHMQFDSREGHNKVVFKLRF